MEKMTFEEAYEKAKALKPDITSAMNTKIIIFSAAKMMKAMMEAMDLASFSRKPEKPSVFW